LPIKRHHVFEPPERSNQKVWRYMDFIKFIYLLENKQLYFSSLETLSKIDPFEGSLGRKNFSSNYQEYLSIHGPRISEEQFNNYTKHYFQSRGEQAKQQRSSIYVNCWHMNDFESNAMWSTYGKMDYGIAITTTYDRMLQSFEDTKEQLYVGKVTYLDYNQSIISLENVFYPVVRKGLSFEHEKELRICYVADHTNFWDLEILLKRPGKSINVNLEKLILELYVSPHAQDWYVELVEKIAHKYGLGNLVRKSNMSGTGYFGNI
jgi:hypothetical protein